MNPTVVKVRTLAATGEYETMTALARDVGVTREWIRQIIRAENIPWHDYHVRLKWDCFGCGCAISIIRSVWKAHWKYMPAHCRACAAKRRTEFCKRGHLRSEYAGGRGQCYICINTRERCVVERRSCVDCGKELRITRAVTRQIKMGNVTGQRCHHCQGVRLSTTHKKKTHCLRGHARTLENVYKTGNCKQCCAVRAKERRAKPKEIPTV